MSEMLTLTAEKRSGLGKGENRRLRTKSLVPGVFYDADGKNVPVQMPSLPLSKLYSKVGRTNVFHLEIMDGANKSIHPVFVWDAQYHPVKSFFTHVDFYGVDLNKNVEITVPVEFVGTSKGVKLGGKLETYREQVILSAKPMEIPRKITVDITDMDVNTTMHVADITLPAGVKAVYKHNYAIVSVLSAAAAAAAAGEEL